MSTVNRRVLLLPLLTVLALGAGAAPPAHPAALPTSTTRTGIAHTTIVPAAASHTLGQWDWPVGIPHVVARGFHAPATRYAAGHRGIDVEAGSGTAVFAPAAGTVTYSGFMVDRPVLAIRHDGELLSSYEALESDLSVGDTVARGQLLGVVAAGGHCDGRCVHFGVRLRGEYISPMLLLGGIPRAVLLPLG